MANKMTKGEKLEDAVENEVQNWISYPFTSKTLDYMLELERAVIKYVAECEKWGLDHESYKTFKAVLED